MEASAALEDGHILTTAIKREPNVTWRCPECGGTDRTFTDAEIGELIEFDHYCRY